MLKIIHRVNKISELKNIPKEYGVEVDIRTKGKNLILNHEPFQGGDLLDDYLSNFRHAFIVLEVKEEGIEKQVIRLCEKHQITKYFLLNVSFPFMYILAKEGVRRMAIRFSEFENVQTCLSLGNRVKWIWVDTFTKLPLNKKIYRDLDSLGFKICLVSPERWNRQYQIKKYKSYLAKNKIKIDAVMVSQEHANKW
ncbi:hypothetical protein HY637_03695 [Candidatus Woesearchaeota archaeon]|nr:hypothetical protein [Candidatus Woesearchaeota archaeon]